uniref:Uncharacterized protein n=1 Tax=Trichogramma kaykai TaxID=54128 RepID=A0ABD2WFS7_9HYME
MKRCIGCTSNGLHYNRYELSTLSNISSLFANENCRYFRLASYFARQNRSAIQTRRSTVPGNNEKSRVFATGFIKFCRVSPYYLSRDQR